MPLWCGPAFAGQLLLRQTLREVRDLNENLEAPRSPAHARTGASARGGAPIAGAAGAARLQATLSTLIASVSHEMVYALGNAGMLASTLWDQTQEFQRAAKSGA